MMARTVGPLLQGIQKAFATRVPAAQCRHSDGAQRFPHVFSTCPERRCGVCELCISAVSHRRARGTNGVVDGFHARYWALPLCSFIAIALLLSACAPAVPIPTQTPTPIPPTATATPFVCQPSTIITDQSPFPEIQGTMQTDGELWALLFFGTAVAEVENKIVWRITGAGGEFTVHAQHEDGTLLDPFWGPQYHESSTWERPGEEWGTSFLFPKGGCWVLRASYGETVGEIVLDVVP